MSSPEWIVGKWAEPMDEDVQRVIVQHLEDLCRQHGEDFAVLLKVVNDSDPIGLLGMDAPPNEYVPEVTLIFERLPEADSVEGLRDLMRGVFVTMFDAEMAGPPMRYEPPAHAFHEYVKGKDAGKGH